ncbi:MAG: VTT domain-containing protein [Desulfobacterales bacterium]|nr:VTT domain-containing protein [Desulfobacterales bacterium]
MINKYRTLLLPVTLIIALGAAIIFFHEDIQSGLLLLKSDRTHPAVIIFSFLVLPAIFFPVSVLLVLIGLRFGVIWGIVIMFLLIPAHLFFSYFLIRRVFHDRLEWLARKKNFGILNIPKGRHIKFGILFMVVPGLPYTIKNYLLPLSGISFRHYFWISWLTQGVMGIPFIVLGEAASIWNIYFVFIAILLFFAGYLINRQIRKRYGHMVESVLDQHIRPYQSGKE